MEISSLQVECSDFIHYVLLQISLCPNTSVSSPHSFQFYYRIFLQNGNKIHFKHKLKGKLRHANSIYIKIRSVSKNFSKEILVHCKVALYYQINPKITI